LLSIKGYELVAILLVFKQNPKSVIASPIYHSHFFFDEILYKNIVNLHVIMNKWRNLYFHQLSKLQNLANYPQGVLVGFNVNIDKIIKITPRTLQMLFNQCSFEIKKASKFFIERINTENDLIVCLLNSIQKGEANELLITSLEVKEWIEQHFSLVRSQIGGQAGIISNFLGKLDAKNVLLSLPTFNQELIHLLSPKLSIASSKDKKLRIEDFKNIDYKEGKDFFFHYIFEFEKGVYRLGEVEIVCPRSNRFIASYDSVNTLLKMKKEFLDYSEKHIQDYKLAIISGFHLIDTRKKILSAKKIFHKISGIFEKWKKKNPELVIHLELAATKVVKTRKLISSTILPFVDSIGLNEQELLSFLKEPNEKRFSIPTSNYTVISLLEVLLSFFYSYPHLRIHFHYLGIYFIISPPISTELAKRRRNSLIASSLIAAFKIKDKLFPIEQLSNFKEEISLEKSFIEFQELKKHLIEKHHLKEDSVKGHFKSPDFSLVCVPTIIVETIEQLVGAGDIISLTSLLFETIQ